ncbi:hypothetical protein ACFL54_04960 [Planctomycetota bacterium]
MPEKSRLLGAMPTYGWSLLLFFAFVWVGGLVLRQVLIPASFGELGRYRADAIKENQSQPLRYMGSAVCAKCHVEHYDLWVYGGHCDISCEVCHGAGKDHVVADIKPRPEMMLPGKASLCLYCHHQTPGRAAQIISQIAGFEEHVKYIDHKHNMTTNLKKAKGRCVFCHDPHSLE